MKPWHKVITTTNTAHTSAPVEVKFAANLAIDVAWTGTGTATVTLEYTPDIEVTTDSVWRTLDTAVAIGTDTSPKQFRYASNYVHNIRAKLAIASGTVTALTVEAFGKGL